MSCVNDDVGLLGLAGKKILVIETALTGHRGYYLKWTVDSFLQNNYQVVVAIPKEYQDHPSICNLKGANLEFQFYDTKLSSFEEWLLKKGLFGRDAYHYLKFKSLYKKNNQHSCMGFVFIPYIDQIIYSTAVFGSPFKKVRFSGISMRPDFHYSKLGLNVQNKTGAFIKEFAFKRFVNTYHLNCLLTLDEPLYQYFIDSHAGKIRFLPEPVARVNIDDDVIKNIVNNLGIDTQKRSVLVFGGLTSRKGIVELLESSIMISKKLNLQFVFAGKADKDMQDYFRKEQFKRLIEEQVVVLIDRYVSEEEESVLFTNAYMCWLGYVNHFRASGVLIAAAKYGLPVIATDQGVIAWQVGRYGLGLCVNVSKSEQINKSIIKLCSDSVFYAECKKNANEAFTLNTLDNAKKIVANSLK